jgi:outer membrane protein insertion porin family
MARAQGGPGAAAADTVSAATPDTAQAAPAAAPERVGEIAVEGNQRVESARILRSFEVAPGARYSKESLRRGLRKLFALGLFQDVWLEELPRGGVVDVVLHVRERPRLGRIEYSGQRKREASELEKKVSLRPGEIVTPTAVQTQVDSLLRYYREEGFARASIDAVLDTSAAGDEVTLRFVIREGERVRIRRVEFSGVTAVSERRLRKQMKSRAKGLFGGGEVKEENFPEDREKVEAYYRNHAYRDARVTDVRLEPGETARDLRLVVEVEEGRPYRIGRVQWQGASVVDSAVLRRLWVPKDPERYDASRIERAAGGAYAEYAEHGYLYLNVDPREDVRDSATVDVTFAITEGRPSHVRMVHIAGNRGTREKVIRREIDIHEGDRFRRSLLVRTQGDIFRLGLFEDVQIDFTAAESTDVDINLKVKEKQVGTASAGAGYTGETGVTGFLELGHNNVLGNGQSLSLHLERGGRREDYYLSFTEPWFRDTPTLLGFSVFNTMRERDYYDEKRVGGSVRIGRPLPWPDYSRGSMSYRLEDVTIRDGGAVGSGLTAIDSVALAGLPLNEAVRTSSFETVFSRNSTDNPFYPTKGTRLELNDEWAGGPFGGSVNFHKHRYEFRAYVPSLVKGVTTMLRTRVGLLGAYPDQNGSVPAYERFRMGGGSTLDPLRGYDDYQVVPAQYVRDVAVAFRNDSTFSGADTTVTRVPTRFEKVRYPGGRFMTLYSLEQQFAVVHPLHALLFVDAGNTWDGWRDIRPFDLKVGAGVGFRMEIPILGNIGLDFGYGFHRDDGPRLKTHFLLGSFGF